MNDDIVEMDIAQTSCCGLREIENLSDYNHTKEAMQAFCKKFLNTDLYGGYTSDKYAFVLFTGVIEERYGQRFARFITATKLGKVTGSRARINPNSENVIKVWIWELNKQALIRWHKKHNLGK